MTYYDEVVAILKELTGTKTIKELSQKLEVSPKNFNTWKTRGEIPVKTLAIFAYKIGVSLDRLIDTDVKAGNNSFNNNSSSIIGSTLIGVNGNMDNLANACNSSVDTPLMREFLELFKECGNEIILKNFIEKLKEFKEISKGMK